jgi:MHS family proline/betaine transporter-like MFS transporter
MVSLATFGIGVLPTYAAIGALAPVLLVCLRMLQGLSAGGELVSSMTFVGEHAPIDRRAFLMCWAQIGGFVAVLAGNVVGLLLSAVLSEADLNAWGWRLPFLLALPLAAVGLYIRRRVSESPEYVEMAEAGEAPPSPLRESLTTPQIRNGIFICGALVLLNSSGYYALFIYMPTYLARSLDFSAAKAFSVTAAAVVVLLIVVPPFARLSDRIGRRPVLIWSTISTIVAAYPCFALARMGMVPAILGLAVLAATFGGYTAIIHPTLIELFPTRVRVTAYSIGYNFTTAIFGGGAPFLLILLIDVTGDLAMPAYYLMLTGAGTLVAALQIRETGGQPLPRDVTTLNHPTPTPSRCSVATATPATTRSSG